MMNAKNLREMTKKAIQAEVRRAEAEWSLEFPQILARLERDAQDGKNISRIFYADKCPKFVLKELKALGFKASINEAMLSDGYFLKVQW
jgi:hypothetical protein